MYRNDVGISAFEREDAIYACDRAAVASKIDIDFNYINNITDRLLNVESQVATLKAIIADTDLKRNKPVPRTFIFSSWKAFEEAYK